jgi:hypothetical protein
MKVCYKEWPCQYGIHIHRFGDRPGLRLQEFFALTEILSFIQCSKFDAVNVGY